MSGKIHESPAERIWQGVFVRSHWIAPPCGKFVDHIASPEGRLELPAAAREWPSWDLTPRQLCDLELHLNGLLAFTAASAKTLLDQTDFLYQLK